MWLFFHFSLIRANAGIDDCHAGGSLDLHSLRVTCATLMLQGGANPRDVQAILGHTTLALTMKVYAKATERGKRSAAGALPFAKVSPPAHVVSVQNVPTVCATEKNAPQSVGLSRLAWTTCGLKIRVSAVRSRPCPLAKNDSPRFADGCWHRGVFVAPLATRRILRTIVMARGPGVRDISFQRGGIFWRAA